MALITDLFELKKVLEIDPQNTQHDAAIWLWIEQATSVIEEYIGRQLTFRSRTEYYGGTDSQKLVLRHRPVHVTPTIQVWVDRGGFFGQASGAFASTTELTYGTDFSLQTDNDDGTQSRCGILVRNRTYWDKNWYRQTGYLSPYRSQSFGTIKVIYSGGYTVDNLPAGFRLAADLLIARFRYLYPLGVPLSSESYEERSISLGQGGGGGKSEKSYMFGLIAPFLNNYRNFYWGPS